MTDWEIMLQKNPHKMCFQCLHINGSLQWDKVGRVSPESVETDWVNEAEDSNYRCCSEGAEMKEQALVALCSALTLNNEIFNY